MRTIDADVLKVTKIVERKRKLFADGRVRKANDWTDVVLLEDIKNAPTIDQYGTWIPCSEKLPEESVKVLIFTDKGHCYIGRLYEENEWFCISEKLVASKVEFSKVIAWMPLPEPYREEKKDE